MSVFANGRSILHAKAGNTHVAAPPDVCKTPSPAGPVPVPYVNIAKDSDLAKGTKKVKIEGAFVALESSNLSTSSGDEPGTAGGGLVSSKTKGKLTWGTSSPDVKIEGKAVARFMDVTQHNGNSFNSAFTALGGTGFAYGDDHPCGLCGEAAEKHRVLELGEVEAMAITLIVKLNEVLDPQRPIIREHQRLKVKRNSVMTHHRAQIDHIEARRAPLLNQRDMLLAATDKDTVALATLAKDLKPIDAELQAAKRQRKAETDALSKQMRVQHEQLIGSNVLVEDDNTGTFTKGYMIGALVCKCPTNPKKLAACSGMPTPGFSKAVANAGFTRVDAFTTSARQQQGVETMGRKTWDCAAPKLLQAGGAAGHKVKSISEKWYSPVVATTVTVIYERNGARVTQDFNSGETVPSCDACQQLVPEMLCDNDKPCA